MERAQSLLDSAGALERNGLADDVDDRELRFDLGDDAGAAADGQFPRARVGTLVKSFVKMFTPPARQCQVDRAAAAIRVDQSPWRCPERYTSAPHPARAHLTTPMSSIERPLPQGPDAESVRAAFAELHGPRLHGFALLLTLGDGPRAARLASEALAAGAQRATELRHPERAAAWLRARIVRAVGRRTARSTSAVPPDALETLGLDPAAIAALEALRPLERAAIVAGVVERLDRRDIATIVGRADADVDRLLTTARTRYMEIFGRATTELPLPGPIIQRVQAMADRALR